GAITTPDGLRSGLARQSSTHRSQDAAWPVGHLSIPAIGLSEDVLAGVSLSVLDRGVGHWAGTAAPGRDGNVVLAGHRTTHTQPFYDLDRLVPGDLVTLTGGDGLDVLYRVTESFVVEPDDVWITYDRPTPTLTMFACHPKGSATRRIVVVADLISPHRPS
ncbi:MAG: class E sortase, partial [Acidimicrobiia bacterium]|nr:class E sortase [Acidimicrobiia bacterium]